MSAKKTQTLHLHSLLHLQSSAHIHTCTRMTANILRNMGLNERGIRCRCRSAQTRMAAQSPPANLQMPLSRQRWCASVKPASQGNLVALHIILGVYSPRRHKLMGIKHYSLFVFTAICSCMPYNRLTQRCRGACQGQREGQRAVAASSALAVRHAALHGHDWPARRPRQDVDLTL